MEIENANKVLQGNDGAIDQNENFNAIPNVIENDNDLFAQNNDLGNNNDVLHKLLVKEALLQAAEGVTPALLCDQNIEKKYAEKFVEKIQTNDLAYWESCSEYWFE